MVLSFYSVLDQAVVQKNLSASFKYLNYAVQSIGNLLRYERTRFHLQECLT